MYDARTRYVATVFVDAMSVVFEPTKMRELHEALGDADLMPHILQGPPPSPPRYAFRSIDGRNLSLFPNRFDYRHEATDGSGTNLPPMELFCSQAARTLTSMLTYFKRGGLRIGLIQDGFLRKMPAPDMQRIADHLLSFPEVFKQDQPIEWDWRCASQPVRQFGEIEQPIIEIAVIRRRSGKRTEMTTSGRFTTEPFDRINVVLEVATLPGSAVAAFQSEDVNAFLKEAVSWHQDLYNSIEEFLSGDIKNG